MAHIQRDKPVELTPEEWVSLFLEQDFLELSPDNAEIQNHDHSPSQDFNSSGNHQFELRNAMQGPESRDSPRSNPLGSCSTTLPESDPNLNAQGYSNPAAIDGDCVISSPYNAWSEEVYPSSSATDSLVWNGYANSDTYPPLVDPALFCDIDVPYETSAANIPNNSNVDTLQSLEKESRDLDGFVMQTVPWTGSFTFTNVANASANASSTPGPPNTLDVTVNTEMGPTKSSKPSSSARLMSTLSHNQRSKGKRNVTDKISKAHLTKDANGNVQGILNIFGAKARARSAYTEEARALTALSRKRGVCERCRKFKARCDMPDSIYEPCRRCSLVVTGVLRQPCIRVNLVDISLHRIGSTKDSALDGWMRSQQTLQIVNGVVGTGHRTLLLTQDFGFELEVTVARYNAGVGDKVSYPWRDASGVAREYKMPPYYMINFEDTKQAMVEYNRRSFVSYIQRNLRDKNPIVWMTFQAAIRHSTKSQSPLVRNALLFWSGARLIERPWRLCGTDTLGLSPNEDIDSPWYGTVPVTPIMDTQLDHLVIDCLLIPLRQRILAQLFDKILKKKKEDWFEIYLAMFVVMYNMERNFAYVLFFTSYYGVMGKFGSRGTSSLSESFIHACKTMLAYFHYVYNGAAILSSPLEKSSLTMPEEQYAYIQALQKERTRQGDDLTLLKDKSMYETDMYWCHQLLFKDCQVEKQNEKEIDELQEEDYLMHSEDD